MDFWPSFIMAPSSISGGVDDPYIEAKSETGDDSARPRFSAERMTPFKLSWKAMPLAEYKYLEELFYPQHRAVEFLWQHPSQGKTYVVRFVSSPVSSSEDGTAPFVASVEVQLQPLSLSPDSQAQPSIDDLMRTINEGADRAVDAATSAADSRDKAAASASAAKKSEENAASSAEAAETSAGTATSKAGETAESAATAGTKAGEASASATAAKDSATSAAASKESAAASATTATDKAEEAATSAATASTKAKEAAASATAAKESETAAAASAKDAAASASTASTKASAAATSATKAQTSVTNAANSAKDAAESASTATAKAEEAAEAAVTATTKAGEAATSAGTASTKASAAAKSATAAKTSETNALASKDAAASSAAAASKAQKAAEAAAESVESTPIATTEKAGKVKPDGSSVTVGADGTIAAVKWKTARSIDGVSADGGADVIHYGVCSTAAATAAKTVACPNFKLGTGARILVRFGIANTAANPTLNVNGTGAKAIKYRNGTFSAGLLKLNSTHEFVYDGTYYQFVGDLDSNTTYVVPPKGAIIMFKGTFGGTGSKFPIPTGATAADTNWALCDGTNGTPDLRNKMIGGADAAGASALSGRVVLTGGAGDFYALAYIMRIK